MLIVFIVSSITHTTLFNGTEWISFLLEMEPPDAERNRSEIERPLARLELERTREQKKPYLAKRASWRRHSQSLSERLTP